MMFMCLESLQRENGELKTRTNELQGQNEEQREEIDKLTLVCMKTRTAIEQLTSSNRALATTREELFVKLQRIEKMHAEAEAEKAEVKQAVKDFARLKKENIDLADMVCHLERSLAETTSEAKQLQGKLVTFDEVTATSIASQSALKIKEAEVKNLNQDMVKLREGLSRKRDELEQDLKLRLAIETEKLGQKNETASSLLRREKSELQEELKLSEELKSSFLCDLERSKIREQQHLHELKEVKDELITKSIELKNFEKNKALEIRKILEECEERLQEAEVGHENTLREMQKASTNNLIDSREEQERLLTEIDLLKQKHASEMKEMRYKHGRLKTEFEKLKQKWYNSIASRSRSSRNTEASFREDRTTRSSRHVRSSSANPTNRPLSTRDHYQTMRKTLTPNSHLKSTASKVSKYGASLVSETDASDRQTAFSSFSSRLEKIANEHMLDADQASGKSGGERSKLDGTMSATARVTLRGREGGLPEGGVSAIGSLKSLGSIQSSRHSGSVFGDETRADYLRNKVDKRSQERENNSNAMNVSTAASRKPRSLSSRSGTGMSFKTGTSFDQRLVDQGRVNASRKAQLCHRSKQPRQPIIVKSRFMEPRRPAHQ